MPSAGTPSLLMGLCNDGYGASGVGEDSFTVGPNRVTHAQYGGSAWRWTTTTVLQLEPPKILSTATDSFHGPDPDRQSSTTFDRVTGRRLTTWSTPECPRGGSFDTVPILDGVDVAATVPLGTCSARADASQQRGWVTHGKPTTADDAALWAVMLDPTTLVVDLADDRWVADADSWLTSDHLEIWVADADPDRHMDWACDVGAARQWAIRLDGTVLSTKSDDGPEPTATRLPDVEGRKRLRVVFPAAPRALTVVYSDSDSGERQDTLVATSALRFRDPLSLGAPAKLHGTTCTAASGTLDLVTPLPDPPLE